MAKQTSVELRKLIIKLHKSGKKLREIAKIVDRSHSTIEYIIKRFKNNNTVENKLRKSNRKIFNDRDERWIVNKIRGNPFLSAVKIAKDVEKFLNKKASPETVRRTLRKFGYNGRIARKKPYIKKNRIIRKKFAEAYVNKGADFWNNVIFADESKFNLYMSDGRINVWRRKNQEYYPKNILPTFKHGGGSVMLWGCMSEGGVGNLAFIDGTMDKWKYLNILKSNLPSSAIKLGLSGKFQFYQDNDPKHTAEINRLWCLYNCPKVIKAPPQSPDLNVIENLWDDLERRIKNYEITSVDTLERAISSKWERTSSEYTKKLVESMPRRLKMVQKSKGYPTKY